MATKNAEIVVDAELAAAYQAAPTAKRKEAISAFREVLRKADGVVPIRHQPSKDIFFGGIVLRVADALSPAKRRRYIELKKKEKLSIPEARELSALDSENRRLLQAKEQQKKQEKRDSRTERSQDQATHFSQKESRLLLTINRGLSAEKRQRIEDLTDKMEYDSITDDEHRELGQLSRESEKLSVRRLKAMIELADLREISFDELLKQLGIESQEYAR
jgi:hypothetical protein